VRHQSSQLLHTCGSTMVPLPSARGQFPAGGALILKCLKRCCAVGKRDLTCSRGDVAVIKGAYECTCEQQAAPHLNAITDRPGYD
jgi:hypothetical protein